MKMTKWQKLGVALVLIVDLGVGIAVGITSPFMGMVLAIALLVVFIVPLWAGGYL